ncbi:hypothetical protein RHD99_05565 [Buttiauxella selenatireducens]|uniref:Uncharacterized protein n=1 Tax=Buttiauxella selenatireducens TaxID=3073902 RepID=A0ABY9SH93_9ENTR|nr:hypothetical protein [Buttiauxella sp. R73]WMY75427.1 hypothetical protein RHD99_05565 [Buttiauxella sp. R73]
MKDIYLKFPSEEQARQVLIQFGLVKDESDAIYHPGICIDVIGTIYTTDDSEAEEPEYKPEAGWHINLRIVDDIDTAELAPFIVTPATPARVWA